MNFARRAHAGATLGVVSGRRRQGKSYLLQALAERLGGLYFAATEATEAESLRLFTEALVRYTGEPAEISFRDWNDAIRHLLRRFRGAPTPVVIDEFPFLSKVTASLPSILQRELGPGGSGTDSMARLLLCGSAMSVMGRLLAGNAPLRGRAGLELVIHPFGYRDAAEFWGITDPRLAVLVHSVVGGTPAYRNEFVQGDAPPTWTISTTGWSVPSSTRRRRCSVRPGTCWPRSPTSGTRRCTTRCSPRSRPATTTNGGIAGYIGRRSDEITHPLNVLEDCKLITREPDLFRYGRARYHSVEPLITFYEAIMRRRWSELESHRAESVWRALRSTFSSQVAGSHFEALCRRYAFGADESTFGGPPAEVGAGVVNDPAAKGQIEIDVVVLAPEEPGRPRRILSLGEAKWGEVMSVRHTERLARARDLLTRKGYDTGATVLACYGAAGFHDELRTAAGHQGILLVGLDDMYPAAS